MVLFSKDEMSYFRNKNLLPFLILSVKRSTAKFNFQLCLHFLIFKEINFLSLKEIMYFSRKLVSTEPNINGQVKFHSKIKGRVPKGTSRRSIIIKKLLVLFVLVSDKNFQRKVCLFIFSSKTNTTELMLLLILTKSTTERID